MKSKKVFNQMAQLKRAGFQRTEWLDKDEAGQYKFVKLCKEIGANCEVCVYFVYNYDGIAFVYDRAECNLLINGEFVGLKSNIQKVSRLAGRLAECMN